MKLTKREQSLRKQAMELPHAQLVDYYLESLANVEKLMVLVASSTAMLELKDKQFEELLEMVNDNSEVCEKQSELLEKLIPETHTHYLH